MQRKREISAKEHSDVEQIWRVLKLQLQANKKLTCYDANAGGGARTMATSAPGGGPSAHRFGELLTVDPPVGTDSCLLQQLVHWTDRRRRG